MPTLKKGFLSNRWICDVCGEEHIYDFRAEECERQHITDNEGEFGGLIGQLGMNSYSGRVSASKELSQIGKPAVEAILKEMDRSDNHVGELHSTRYSKESGANALGDIGDKRALEPLIKLMKYNYDDGYINKPSWEKYGMEHDIKRAAIRALVKSGDKRAVPSLIKALGDEDKLVRNSTAGALGKFGDKRAVQPLIKALGDSWGGAAKALGELGDKRAVQPLIKALGELGYGDGLGSVASALGELGDKRAVQPLIKFLEDNDRSKDDDKAAASAGLRRCERITVPKHRM